jgi:hypothetical protein
MIVRGTYVYLLKGTVQTNAFFIEVVFGAFLPFVLFSLKRVRRSPGGLFFASTVFVIGILLSRIDVFLVSYTPPYGQSAYFPALGEIFITLGLIASLMFLYRVIIFVFPVLPAQSAKWAAMLAGAALIPILVLSPAGVSAENPKKAQPALDKSIKSKAPPKVLMLNSPMIQQYSDLYDPVPFDHSKHLAVVKDCTVCHHRQPREQGDTYGEPLNINDLKAAQKYPAGCSTCHGRPFNPRQLHVPGLMGAYHQLCLDCHRKSEHLRKEGRSSANLAWAAAAKPVDPAKRPLTDCLTCHAKKGTGTKTTGK